MSVASWIWVLKVQNILGVGISKLAIQSRKDLIDVWLLIVGF